MIAIFPLVGALLLQPAIVIDNFESVSAWKALPSDDVSLEISQDSGITGKSMRVDFDFRGHGGYAVIRRDVNLTLPANYEFSFSIRGPAPENTLEFKLVDPTGENVWWSNQPRFVFPSEWRQVVRKKRHISFAWGPIGGGEMKTVAGIELAITAGTGGKGTVWLDDLVLTQLEPDRPYDLEPKMTVGREQGGRQLNIDFLKRREFGGVVIDWNQRPSSYTVSTSKDGVQFTDVARFWRSISTRDYLFLPESDARYMRLTFPPQQQFTASSPFVAGLKEISVKPLEWSATKNEFFSAVAADAPPGAYPRYFSGRQSYWTVIGVSGDTREALMDEQGALESGKAQFSVEPFVFSNGKLFTWNDATRTTGSLGMGLPIPFVTWKLPQLEMTVTAFASGKPDSSVLYARYRIRNSTAAAQRAKLYLAIRPFQVNPPWQFLNTQGGFAAIDSISFDAGRVRVNSERSVIPVTPGAQFGAISFREGNLVELLRQSRIPSATGVADPISAGSGVLAWDVQLRAGGDTTIEVAIPLHAYAPACLRNPATPNCGNNWVRSELAAVEKEWDTKLSRVSIKVPSSASRIPNTVRANLAYVLINKDGPAIQPGSRSYERSWIRDGALTSAALLRLGLYDEVREFIDWYAKFQFDNGKIPCCVDAQGAGPVPENDSHGQFIYLIAEYYRHTGDRALLERTWPNVTRAFAFMDSLRLSRTTPEFQTGEKRLFYGLMPQSISHEGYSAKPMHSYWDDFFALRGYKDAVEIAKVLGKPEATRYAEARDTFRKDFYASIERSMAQHKIDYIPGAAELGDFDATSTTIALNPADEETRLPQAALARTFEKYYENFRTRRDGTTPWEGYTPYEWRTVGTFVRLGQKARAHEIADWFFEHQRPKAWHHWAEVVFKETDNPKFIGDMPHTWVGSDFIRSTLDMFAFERDSDSSIVIGAGIPAKWVLEESGTGISRLSTHYGLLSYTMRAAGREIEVRIDPGIRVPPGGLVVHSPVTDEKQVVRSLPAVVKFRY